MNMKVRFTDNSRVFKPKFGEMQTINGKDGKSAYEIAIDNGFKGTESEWLDSLQGNPGEPGISPIITVTDIDGGHRVTITDAHGEKSFDVMNGKGGGLPEGGAAHQMLVTDAKGKTIWDNKTHWIDYEFDPIEWHGDTEGREVIDASAIGMGIWYKISDQVIPFDVFKAANLTANGDMGFYLYNTESVIDNVLYYNVYLNFLSNSEFAYVMVLAEPIEMAGVIADSPGIYIMPVADWWDGLSYVKLISDEIVNPLDEKFLPKTVVKNNDLNRYVSIESLDTILAPYIDDKEYKGKLIYEANFPNATSVGNEAFAECSRLRTINFPNAKTIGREAFKDCIGLENVEFRRATSIGRGCFEDCMRLRKADLYKLSSIESYTFYNAQRFDTLIIRGATMVCSGPAGEAFWNTPIESGTGYIYVPASMVDAYKADADWSVYANQIRAIEDYPEITGG